MNTNTLKNIPRVVVTGLGIISPVGNDINSAWQNIKSGKNGIRPITDYDASGLPVRFRGNVLDFNSEQFFDKKEIRKMDLFIHYGVAAGIQAIKDSGIDFINNPSIAKKTGVIIGSGIGGLQGMLEGYQDFINFGARRVSPFYVPRSIINMTSGHLSIRYGLQGPNLATTTACASATHSIAQAFRLIQMGDADVMIAGGSEMASNAMGVAGFAAAKALSTRNDSPETASRPWDKDRDGFVLGDGAGVLLLETLEHAQKRGAKIYGEIIGMAMTSDAHHITAPLENGDGAARCMELALKDAQINADQINYINAHGTSTPAGDLAETKAIKKALKDHAYKVTISSTKSMTGHALGAAGGLEAVFTLLSLRDQIVPPTINLINPDPECDLDYTPNCSREHKIDIAMSNSFGFGGTNGTLIFRKV